MTERLHAKSDIDELLAVAEGRKIGHIFISHLDLPIYVYQDPETETFTDSDIAQAQGFFAEQIGEPYVYNGTMLPEEALAMALAMQHDNSSSQQAQAELL